ncbi:unnamed protein product [Protopolystoma xenopodis]|uniref:Uncharacterized protein n=1 Tax=Protopolystoma xenopodis TaxID=117903 RepID=A0A3S5BYD5_9PLAT|nr:unnamed protein product [Protopolystoma xenopodis]
MARLTDDVGETSVNVPHPRSYSGYDDAYYGLRTRGVPLDLPANMTKLRKQGQTTSINRNIRPSEKNRSMFARY